MYLLFWNQGSALVHGLIRTKPNATGTCIPSLNVLGNFHCWLIVPEGRRLGQGLSLAYTGSETHLMHRYECRTALFSYDKLQLHPNGKWIIVTNL